MSWFWKKCKHKDIAVESFVYKGSLLYSRIIVYKCDKCGRYCYTDRWAFCLGSGALDNYFPEHKDYISTGDMSGELSEDEYISLALKMLNKYFPVVGNTVKGLRIE